MGGRPRLVADHTHKLRQRTLHKEIARAKAKGGGTCSFLPNLVDEVSVFFPVLCLFIYFLSSPHFLRFSWRAISLSSPGLIEARTGREVQYKVRPNSVLSSERKQAGPPACGSTYIRLCLSRHPPRHAEERARTVAGHLQVAKRIRHAAHEAPAGRRAVAQDLAPRSPQMEPSPSLVAERRA